MDRYISVIDAAKTDYYKVLVNGQSCHNGTYHWDLPDGDTPGKWTPTIANPVICETGYHLTTEPMQWARIGMQVYAAQPGAIKGTEDDKIVTDRARLLREAPEMIPDWWRAVERFVTEDIPAAPWFVPDGNPDPAWRLFTAPTLVAAAASAGKAASDAAGAAGWGAAWAAARAAAGGAAWNVAWDAAWAVAGDVAWDAARAAVWDAAGSAAGDVAWDAALYVLVTHVCAELPLDQKHRDHVAERWNVWKKGYCVLCDVDGVLFVYAAQGIE